MWDYWFMSTTHCNIITTRCRLHGTSTTAFHRSRAVYRLGWPVGSVVLCRYFCFFCGLGNLGWVDSAKTAIFSSELHKIDQTLVQVHDILTVMHKIAHWLSVQAHSRYCCIHLPELGVTGHSAGWIKLGWVLIFHLRWVGSGRVGSWPMDP